MKYLIHNRHFYYMLLMDVILVAGSFYSAYLIRFEFSIPGEYLSTFFKALPYVLVVKMCSFSFFNLYRGMWRYTSLIDLVNVCKAVFTSSLFIIMAVLMVHRFHGYPRSVFIIDGFLTFLTIGGIRVAIRLYFARRSGFEIFPAIRMGERERKRLLIIGAGDAGEKLLREIRDNPGLKFEPVGFLDDNPDRQGRAIHGVPVLGTLENMVRLRESFDEVLIAVPSSKGEEMRRIVEICERTGKRYRIMPSIGELIDGRVSIKTVRDVTLADLVGREEVHLDHEGIKRYLHQKRILITGAGGSIGSELVRQSGRFHPQALALLDVSELNLFQVEMECQQRFSYIDKSSFLVDVRNQADVERVFSKFRPQVVFHAAAYKHVPMQELNPWEAVFNNVLGTRNLLEVALKNRVERFVFVSTDKAVRPVSVMGATKRVAEMIVGCMSHGAGSIAQSGKGIKQSAEVRGQRAERGKGIQELRDWDGFEGARLMSVRFGNVIGSSGSALPIFQDQIARGGPVTVTHPEVTRYFMSIPESAQLILQAGAMGESGEIFILDMGKPIRILDMARDLIRLHGFEPERDIPIQFIGLRPGEKLYEELITQGEGVVSTAHEKILVLRGNACERKDLEAHIDELISVARTNDANAIKKKLKEIVPEYRPQFW